MKKHNVILIIFTLILALSSLPDAAKEEIRKSQPFLRISRLLTTMQIRHLLKKQ